MSSSIPGIPPVTKLPEFRVHPKNMEKTSGFKDFSPKPIERLYPTFEDQEVVETQEDSADELPEEDPKGSSVPASANSSESSSSETSSNLDSTPTPEQAMEAVANLPHEKRLNLIPERVPAPHVPAVKAPTSSVL